jgi:membrane protein DedA with SNARE-associated domain
MSHLLDTLQSLPPTPLYIAIGVLAAIENIFPPVPADTAVALGAFLAGRGVLDAWVVFGITWVGNVGSAALVYSLGRRYGRAFFSGRIGRRLLSEKALQHIEDAYAAHGSYGILVSRLLPVWRAVVPPFAGVVGVPAVRALVPMAAASAVYYGALTYLVFRLGTDFELVARAVARANLVLGIVAAVLVVALVWWFVRRKRGQGSGARDSGPNP